MSASRSPKQEHPDTYFVQNRANQDELRRLQIVDDITTIGMGGVLSEQPDPTAFQRVLDVGCGTGGWLIELAKTSPTCTTLVGVDVSLTYVEYARAKAAAAQVSDRVEFRVGDALRMLEFPDASFDLVNHRLATSWLRTWDWPHLLQEYQRVAQPGGIIRITEPEVMVLGNRPALNHLSGLFLRAFYQAGHGFTPMNDGVTSELAHVLHQYGLQQVQTKAYTLQYRGDTPEGQLFFEDVQILYRNIVPFLQKWIRVPDNYKEIYQQMLDDMQQPDFVATWSLLTAWGNTPF